MFFTVHRPPWALAIASTIASPSPTPPADRVRAASARAKRSKIRASASSGIPQPSSSTSISNCAAAPLTARSSIASFLRVYLIAFSISASSAARSRSGSAATVPGVIVPSRHARGATSDQRMNTSSRNGSISMPSICTKSGWSAVASRRSRPMIASIRPSSSSATSSSESFPLPSSSSRWPRAIVTGVRSSCEASCMNRSWRSSIERRSSARACAMPRASSRRRACHTISTTITTSSGPGAQDRLPVGPGDDRGVARDGERRPQELHPVASK